MENMVNVYFFGKKYTVPADLTIMTAMEYAGYTLKRGCGCRHGFCGDNWNSVTQKCFHTRIRAGSTFHLYRLSEQITELIFRQAPGGCDWHMLLQENGITVHSVHKKHLAECHQ